MGVIGESDFEPAYFLCGNFSDGLFVEKDRSTLRKSGGIYG